MSDQARKSDLIDLTLQLHAKTAKAIRISDTGEDEQAVWLPLSQIEMEPRPRGIVVVTLPEWLALEKGLI